MSREKINVEKRESLGRKANRLRRSGILPANVYGAGVASVAIQLGQHDFVQLLKKAGETELIDLQIADEKGPRPVLIYDVQTEPITLEPLHVDFFQVNLKEKVEVTIPIELVGEAPVVVEKRGVLLQIMNEVQIEVLPADIPHAFELDISKLNAVGDTLALSDLPVPAGVDMLVEDMEELVVKIEAVVEAADELAKMDAETAEQEQTKAEEAAAEPAEGEESNNSTESQAE